MAESRPTSGGTVLLVALCCVLGMALAPGVLAQATGGGGEESYGAQVSSFMQSTAADANGSVERGMWDASVSDDADPAVAIDDRARSLQARLDALERRSEALAAARANGSISGVAYTARASAIHAQIANLQAAVNQTMTTAERHGVNSTRLDELRQAAGNATGPEIAAMARNITDAGGGPPPWVDDGPPDDGPPDDGGPPDDAPGDGSGNDGEGGPPDEPPGDGSGNGDEGGPPDDGPPGDGGPPADG